MLFRVDWQTPTFRKIATLSFSGSTNLLLLDYLTVETKAL